MKKVLNAAFAALLVVSTGTQVASAAAAEAIIDEQQLSKEQSDRLRDEIAKVREKIEAAYIKYPPNALYGFITPEKPGVNVSCDTLLGRMKELQRILTKCRISLSSFDEAAAYLKEPGRFLFVGTYRMQLNGYGWNTDEEVAIEDKLDKVFYREGGIGTGKTIKSLLQGLCDCFASIDLELVADRRLYNLQALHHKSDALHGVIAAITDRSDARDIATVYEQMRQLSRALQAFENRDHRDGSCGGTSAK